MNISSSAVSLTVADVSASSQFLQQHFGFQEQWVAASDAQYADNPGSHTY